MDYSKMSDFEVNLKIAHIILGKDNYDWNSDKKEVYLAGIDGGDFLPNGYFDPCNNPADAWPIIICNGISLYHDNGNWQAEMTYYAPVGAFGTDETCSKFVDDKNPLRAAMIVFLMMQEAK